MTEDPIGYEGGQNIYDYCESDPINQIDILGLYDIKLGGFEFTNDVVASGLSVGTSAAASSATFGIYNGGSNRQDPAFNTSRFLADQGRDTLLTIVGVGVASKIAKIGQIYAIARAAEKAEEAAALTNKLIHIFGKAEHGLAPIVKYFGGEKSAYYSILRAFSRVAGKYTSAELAKGIEVSVGPFKVIVRGAIVKGIAKIGTVFIK